MAKANIPIAIAQANAKSKNASRIRMMIAELVYWNDGLTQVELGELLHRSQGAISQILQNHKKMYSTDDFYKNEYLDLQQKYREAHL